MLESVTIDKNKFYLRNIAEILSQNSKSTFLYIACKQLYVVYFNFQEI